MKLATLKVIVYTMGILLVGSVLFLGYAIYQKVKNPNWRPLGAAQPTIVASSVDDDVDIPSPTWSLECITGFKQMEVINNNRIVIMNSLCNFADIYNENGQFINRIELKDK